MIYLNNVKIVFQLNKSFSVQNTYFIPFNLHIVNEKKKDRSTILGWFANDF